MSEYPKFPSEEEFARTQRETLQLQTTYGQRIEMIVGDEEMCNQISAFVKMLGNEYLGDLYEDSKRAILNDFDPDGEIDRSFVVRHLLSKLIIFKKKSELDMIMRHVHLA